MSVDHFREPDPPRWSTIVAVTTVLFLLGGVIGLLLAVMIAVIRTRRRSAATDGGGGAAMGAATSDRYGPTIGTIVLVLDLIALLLGQYVGVLALRSAVFFSGDPTAFEGVFLELEERLLAAPTTILVAVGLMWIGGRYRRLMTVRDGVVNASWAITAVFVAEVLILGRPLLSIGVWGASLVLLSCAFVIARGLLFRLGLLRRDMLVVGVDGQRQRIMDAVRPGGPRQQVEIAADVTRPSATLEAALERIFTSGAELESQVVLCPRLDEFAEALQLCRRIEARGIACVLAFDTGPGGRDGLGDEVRFIDGVLVARGALRRIRPFSQVGKRLIDVVGGAVGLCFALPVLGVIAPLILRDGGPLFFAHERVGRHGRRFPCFKLRSMRPDADRVLAELLARDPVARAEWERDFKLRDDPRITGVGAMLRRTSLDELPQLWNVIRGEMSLVGPRPIVPAELEHYYGDAAAAYMSVKPGLTGLWQISGRNDLSYAERVALDTRYARTWSLGTDVMILLRTVEIVLLRRGAY